MVLYASGSQKFKMAAHKYSKYSYLSLYAIRSCTILTDEPMYSKPVRAMKLCFTLRNASGDHKSKMAARNQEILVSSMYTPFLHNHSDYIHGFQVQDANEAILYIMLCKRKL